MMNNKAFILMADVINSRDFLPESLMKNFRDLCEVISQEFRNNFISPLTITLGDEFQCVVKSEKDGIEVIMAFEEQIIKSNFQFALRFVLLQGKIETEINTKVAHGMLGQGLTEARQTLQDMKKTDHRYFVKLENPVYKPLEPILQVYQYLIDSWDVIKDYPTVAKFLDNQDYKEVARRMGLNASQIWKRKKTLKMDQYFQIKKAILLLLHS
jgi:hypothetical protein